MIPQKSEQIEKMSTMMEDVSASRITDIQNSFFNTCEKIYLPISFVRFKPEKGLNDAGKSGVEVTVSEDSQTVHIFSDQRAKVFNEYHLMEYMGLSKASD